jgi:hypothetical protein
VALRRPEPLPGAGLGRAEETIISNRELISVTE